MSNIEIRVVSLGPELAQDWLDRFNSKNRPMDPKGPIVNEYARRMTAGEWMLNGEPIIFSTEERLLDGQHRLQAVVNSGETIEFLKVEGVDPRAFTTIGNGKTRSGGDVLALLGYPNHVQLAAAAKWFDRYEHSDMYAVGGMVRTISNLDLIHIVQEHGDLVKSVERVREAEAPRHHRLRTRRGAPLHLLGDRLTDSGTIHRQPADRGKPVGGSLASAPQPPDQGGDVPGEPPNRAGKGRARNQGVELRAPEP